jgi:hypothetical protein
MRLAQRPTVPNRFTLRMATRWRSVRAIANITSKAASCSPNVCQSIGSTCVVSFVPGREVFEISAVCGSDLRLTFAAQMAKVEGPGGEILHPHSHELRAYR